MGYRKEYRRRSQDRRPLTTARGEPQRCAVCQEIFDSPTLSIKVGKKDRAHVICAALSRVGLGRLAKTSGRW
ncbi:MAG: hypothetical protein ACFCU8_16075 [Thermosynechococcaceae cyanobacterium]